MPPQPKTDKSHLDKMLESMDKVFRKGDNLPETPEPPKKPDSKTNTSTTTNPPRR